MLARAAMRLRDEQLRARVVYVDAGSETNAELDAITARVVQELQALQRAGMTARTPADPEQLERELVRALQELLEKMVSARREHFLRHKIELIQRKIANLYFTAEVSGAEHATQTTYIHPDDALLASLRRHEAAIVADLEGFRYREAQLRDVAIERFRGVVKQLAGEVLKRSRPELERLLVVYREVLVLFLMRDFREGLDTFAKHVIHESEVADGHDLAYKIQEGQFARFREVFEARFMDRLLGGIQGPLERALVGDAHPFRDETLRFAADPRIYAEICAVMSNAVYDYLHGEGFLDLPVTWQRQLAEEL